MKHGQRAPQCGRIQGPDRKPPHGSTYHVNLRPPMTQVDSFDKVAEGISADMELDLTLYSDLVHDGPFGGNNLAKYTNAAACTASVSHANVTFCSNDSSGDHHTPFHKFA